MTSLLVIGCLHCGHQTPTTVNWLLEHGLICEGCFKTIPLNIPEIEHGLAAIEESWAELDAAVLTLRRPVGRYAGGGADHLIPG